MNQIIFTLICAIFAFTKNIFTKTFVGDKYQKYALKELIKDAIRGNAESQYIVGYIAS